MRLQGGAAGTRGDDAKQHAGEGAPDVTVLRRRHGTQQREQVRARILRGCPQVQVLGGESADTLMWFAERNFGHSGKEDL